MISYIIATIREVGFHNWPSAPADVGYLAQPHRHVFTFRVKLRVWDTDRELEFHRIGRVMKQILRETYTERPEWVTEREFYFVNKSCEMLAHDMLVQLRKLQFRSIKSVEVWEDDTDGACVEVET